MCFYIRLEQEDLSRSHMGVRFNTASDGVMLCHICTAAVQELLVIRW